MGWKVVAALACGILVAPTRAGAIRADSTAAAMPGADAPPCRVVGRGDLAYLAVSAGAIAYAGHDDRWFMDETTEGRSAGEHRLASWVEPLGNAGIVLPALALSYGVARWSGHAEAARAMLRIGVAVGAAGGASLMLKEAVGRSRPSEAPDDATRFRPFSGRTSFPSGHATIAFAAAAAIHREASAGWVPWVVYPGAALVGWSRVHEQRHWTSDVVAGAAMGIWTARRTDAWLRCRDRGRERVGFDLLPDAEGARLTVRF